LHSVEKGLRGFQIGRVEACGEPVVDRLEESERIGGTVLIAVSRAKLASARSSHDSAACRRAQSSACRK
jgi:hypothetical protein